MNDILNQWHNSLGQYEKWTQQRLHPAYIESVRVMGKMFSDFSGGRGLVLDIGCGNGSYSSSTYGVVGYTYVNYPCFYIGIEPLRGTQRDFPFVQAVGEDLPFKSNQFDSVLIVTSLDHMYDPVSALQEGYRVLKEQGILSLATGLKQNGKPSEDPFHLFIPSEAQLSLLLAPFFDLTGLCHLRFPGLAVTFARGKKRERIIYQCIFCHLELNEEVFRDLLFQRRGCPHCARRCP